MNTFCVFIFNYVLSRSSNPLRLELWEEQGLENHL